MSDAIPRFNHIALSVPAEALDASGREALLRFYGEVFGWTGMPGMDRDRELLVLRCHSNEQFVYIHASQTPMRCGTMEHFGMSVSAPDQLDAIYERAVKFREADAEVEILERKLDDFKAVKLHSFYVRYRLPVMIEVQCFEWAEGLGAQSLPD